MNCREYRRAVGADPAGAVSGAAGHAADCEACRGFHQEMLALDERIGRALAIDVPRLQLPELPPVAARDGPAKVAAFARQRPLAAPLWLGLAAGIAAAVVLMFGLREGDRGNPQLAEQILAHMQHEESSRTVTSVPVAFDTLEKVMAPDVTEMNEDVGLITYAMSCVINGRRVPHLVVQGRSGPVTLILLPDEEIDAPVPLSGENVYGLILPVGSGSVAVIGQREEQRGEIDAIGRRLARTLEWKI